MPPIATRRTTDEKRIPGEFDQVAPLPEFDRLHGACAGARRNPSLFVITSYSIHYTKLYEFADIDDRLLDDAEQHKFDLSVVENTPEPSYNFV